jgi:anaerobic selenocysteine-containing dehydrogenase
VAGVHTCGFYPVADFHNPSKLTVLWGSNITSTNEEGEICSLLLDRIKNGTELIIVDPRKTKLVEKSKYWLQLRPGTDNALALAFLNVIIKEALYDKPFVQRWTHGFDKLSSYVEDFTPEKVSEITWVSPELIRESARYYALSHPAIIQWGNAIEQHIHTFDTARALTCLMALCGNLDVPGGNIHANEPNILSLGKLVRGDLIPSKKDEMIPAHNKAIPRLMTVPPAHFKRAVLTGDPYPVKGAYMQCTNPLVCNAESKSTYNALEKLDFLAVSEIFMTPTASMADIVLPAATTFEFNDIGHAGLGHGIVLARPKVVDPPGECRPDIRILNDLGKIITSERYWYDDYTGFLEEILEPSGLSYEEFVNVGYLKGREYYRKYEKNGFRTPTGKVELFLSHHKKLGCSPLPRFTGLQEEDDAEYPLILTSRKSKYYLHSSYRWLDSLRKKRPHPKTDIHTQTGVKYGIKEGDEVVIETRTGRITQVAHLTDSVHPRVIYSAYGWWFPEAGPEDQYNWEKSNYNMLTSVEKLGREFGTPNLKGINCRISKK